MKKLMILAAVVCAAVVSQASSVDWEITGKDSSLQRNKAVYVFDTTDRTTILALLEAGTSNAKAAEILANSAWTSAVKATGETDDATTPYAGGSINLGDDVASRTEKSYFAIIFNKSEAEVNSATKYFVTDNATGRSYTPDQQADRILTEMSFATKSSVAIPTASIPEPTSGLLLLLGVAGLALKRKHA